jgi:hypothetical protein
MSVTTIDPVTAEANVPDIENDFNISPLEIANFTISKGMEWNAERRGLLDDKIRVYCTSVGYAADCIAVDIEIVEAADEQTYPCAIVYGKNETPHPEKRNPQPDGTPDKEPVYPGDRILYRISCRLEQSPSERASTLDTGETPSNESTENTTLPPTTATSTESTTTTPTS